MTVTTFPNQSSHQGAKKTCTLCKVAKSVECFGKKSQKPDGRSPWCRDCTSSKNREYREKYPENTRQRKKEERQRNKGRYSAYGVEYRKTHKEKIKKYLKEYARNHKQDRQEYRRIREANEPLFRLERRFRCLVSVTIRDGGYAEKSSLNKILGCDWPTFKSHIESQFKPGMSWRNRSSWQIDHVIPTSSAKNAKELRALFHYKNTQPLWPEENRAKAAMEAA